MKNKIIDPVDVKVAVKNGQLKSFVKNNIIYLQDVDSGDTVMIGKIEKERAYIWQVMKEILYTRLYQIYLEV